MNAHHFGGRAVVRRRNYPGILSWFTQGVNPETKREFPKPRKSISRRKEESEASGAA